MQYPEPGRARLLALAEEDLEEQIKEKGHAMFDCPCRLCNERRAEEREQTAREDRWPPA